MQALVDFIVRNLLALWPIARVQSWEQGVRVRGGILREELAPGLHWRWWFLDEVKTWPVSEVVADLGVGAVTTTDGKSVVVSANLSFRMISIRQMWAEVWNVEVSVKNAALGVLTSTCAGYDSEYLRSNRPQVEAAIMAAINDVVRGWGLEVIRVNLTDCVAARPLRLFGEP